MHQILNLLLMATAAARVLPDPAVRDVLGVLAGGHSRNRETFTVIDCRFEWAEGKAASVEGALGGRFIEKRVTQRGHWLLNGPNVRYELLCEPDLRLEGERIKRQHIEQKKNAASGQQPPKGAVVFKGGGILHAPCIDQFYLRNASYVLTYGPGNLAANLFTKTDPGIHGIEITPFNLGVFGGDEGAGPSIYLKAALGGRCPAKFEGIQRINGVDVLVVRVGPSLEQIYGFDPARGYLLVYYSYMNTRSRERSYETHVTDTRHCSGDRWFPMRTVFIDNPETPAAVRVKELTVIDADLDSEPRADRFRLELPAGARVVNVDRVDSVGLARPETVGVNDLAELDKRCLKRGQERAMLEKAKTQPDGDDDAALDRSGGRAALLIACVVLAAAPASLVALKRRR